MPMAVLGAKLYRVDLKDLKLIEQEFEMLAGKYRVRYSKHSQQLFHGDDPLSKAGTGIQVAVSPDEKRAVWIGEWPARDVYYHAAGEGTVRTVVRGGWHAGAFLWVDEKDLAPGGAAPKVPGEGAGHRKACARRWSGVEETSSGMTKFVPARLVGWVWIARLKS